MIENHGDYIKLPFQANNEVESYYLIVSSSGSPTSVARLAVHTLPYVSEPMPGKQANEWMNQNDCNLGVNRCAHHIC